MNLSLALAGIGAILLGLAHSVIGERMVMRPLIAWTGDALDGSKILSMQQRRVLRASWHLVTCLGLGFAALLLSASASGSFAQAKPIVAVTFIGAAIYWLVATRGRHPAYVVLLIIAALTAFG